MTKITKIWKQTLGSDYFHKTYTIIIYLMNILFFFTTALIFFSILIEILSLQYFLTNLSNGNLSTFSINAYLLIL